MLLPMLVILTFSGWEPCRNLSVNLMKGKFHSPTLRFLTNTQISPEVLTIALVDLLVLQNIVQIPSFHQINTNAVSFTK